MSLIACFGEALRLDGGEAVLGLPLEFRLADEHREHAAGADHHVVLRDVRRALALAGALGVIAQAARQRGAQARLVRAAVLGRDRVAVGGDEPVRVRDPRDRPFDRAVAAGLANLAGEDVGMDQRGAVQRRGEEVGQPALEVEGLLLRHVVDAREQRLVARPADLDAAEEIGLGARHLEHARRLERGLGAEDFRVGLEANGGAAPVRRAAHLLELALRDAALERHRVKLAAARDLDLHALRERVRDRDADAMQAARGLVNLRVEFAARVQRAHDHFERGFFRELGMRIDRHAAPVVDHGDEAVGRHAHVDPVGVAGERLVHRIVDHLGEQMMQRLLVGAADIHAGAAAHRLEPFQHLDVARRVGGIARRGLAAHRS